jgi:hypothetical protein
MILVQLRSRHCFGSYWSRAAQPRVGVLAESLFPCGQTPGAAVASLMEENEAMVIVSCSLRHYPRSKCVV